MLFLVGCRSAPQSTAITTAGDALENQYDGLETGVQVHYPTGWVIDTIDTEYNDGNSALAVFSNAQWTADWDAFNNGSYDSSELHTYARAILLITESLETQPGMPTPASAQNARFGNDIDVTDEIITLDGRTFAISERAVDSDALDSIVFTTVMEHHIVHLVGLAQPNQRSEMCVHLERMAQSLQPIAVNAIEATSTLSIAPETTAVPSADAQPTGSIDDGDQEHPTPKSTHPASTLNDTNHAGESSVISEPSGRCSCRFSTIGSLFFISLFSRWVTKSIATRTIFLVG